MSAATENPAPIVTADPEVGQHTAKVEPSAVFQDAHIGDAKDPLVTEPAATASTNPQPETTTSVTSDSNDDASKGPSKEQKISKKETQITATPITSGTLGYKAPGIMSIRFKPHHFWLGDAAVPIADLTQYLRGEKPDVSHPTAAWSTQTGKGLLYFSKSEDSKKTPGGVLNLTEAANVAKEGDKIFSFRLGRHKHSFEAKSQDERNGWVVAITSAHEEAQKTNDIITASSGYKDSLADLNSGKSTVGAATGAATAGGVGVAATAHAADDKKEEKAVKKEERRKSDSSDDKKKTKSRSRSNKRSSVFGSIIGKKDEKKEEKAEKQEEKKEKKEEKAVVAAVKKEEKKEEKEEKKEEKAAAAEAKKVEKEEEKEETKADKEEKKAKKKEEKKHEGEAATGAAALGAAGTTIAAEHKKPDRVPEKDNAKEGTERIKSKRRSILGIFDKSAKSPNTEKKESEVVPAAAATTTSEPRSEVNKAELKTVDGFKGDAISPDDSAKKEAKKETAASSNATSEAKAEGGKSEDSGSPSTSKRFNLGSVFRRPSKQAKSATEEDKRDKETFATPATVPEVTSEADKSGLNTAAKTEGAVTEPEEAALKGLKSGEPAIGDVVPDAITVGEGEGTKPLSTTA